MLGSVTQERVGFIHINNWLLISLGGMEAKNTFMMVNWVLNKVNANLSIELTMSLWQSLFMQSYCYYSFQE